MSDNHQYPFCHEDISTENAMREHLWMCASKTEQCSRCSKYIERMFFAYHQDTNCQNPSLTDFSQTNSNPKKTNVITKFGNLLEHLNNELGERVYSSEIKHLKEKLESIL